MDERRDKRERILFEFSAEDMASSSSKDTGWEDSHYTDFDKLLLGRWEQAMRAGAFRYDLSEVVSRTVPGQYGFVALNNPKRFSHRRPPAEMQTLVQPFNPDQFNFNKVKETEVLFEVSRKAGQDATEREGHMVAVNVSPIDRGHVLLIPNPTSCLPQVMTQSSLQLCLELISLSGHRGFCMVANSLLAYASVNHLHYHFMYTAYPLLPAGTMGGREVRGCRGCYELTGHYIRGFGFQMTSEPEACARMIYKAVSLLVESGVPHNIAMIRGPPFSGPPTSNDPSSPAQSVIRTILIPRKPALGFKQVYCEDKGRPPFFAASCELALGLIPVTVQERYPTITEEEILQRLREQELTEEAFSGLLHKLCESR